MSNEELLAKNVSKQIRKGNFTNSLETSKYHEIKHCFTVLYLKVRDNRYAFHL
jgi:hypothetical protein